MIDCPDIPLNVSRSFLQNDRQVQKISKHITKKVADKLTALFNNERERYNECWKDIATFIKFGCLKDDEFYEKVKDIVIFKNLGGEYKPLNDFLGEEVSEEDAGKGVQPKAVYYVSDEAQQAQYIKMFKDAGLDAVVCDTYIDPHFISYIESVSYTPLKKVLGDAGRITYRPADDLKPEYEEVKKKVIEMGYYEKEEDVLSYAVFEQVAENFFKWREAQKDGVDRDLAKGNVYPV